MDQSRWVKPLDVEPGHWKKQLPTKFLNYASAKNDSKLRDLLHKQPELVNKQGPHGRTFLFEAIRKGRVSTVRWLLDQGADPNLTGCYNNESLVQLSAIATSRYYAREEIEPLFIMHDARWDIWRAAFCDERHEVKSFLAREPQLVNAEDARDEIYYYTPLSFAVAGGHLSLAKELVSHGAELQRYGVQLLFLASHINSREVLEWLIANGARADDANSSMWMATNDLQILEVLVEAGLSANQTRYSDLTPLHYVCRGDKGEHVGKVKMLLELGTEVNAIGPKGRSALHYASNGGYVDSIKLLLAYGADKNVRDNTGMTALDLALTQKHSHVVETLRK